MYSTLLRLSAIMVLLLASSCSNSTSNEDRQGEPNDPSFLLVKDQVLPTITGLMRSTMGIASGGEDLMYGLMLCDISTESCQQTLSGLRKPLKCGGGSGASQGFGEGFRFQVAAASYGCPEWSMDCSEVDTTRYLHPDLDSNDVHREIRVSYGYSHQDSLNVTLSLVLDVICDGSDDGVSYLNGNCAWSLLGSIVQDAVIMDSIYLEGNSEVKNLAVSSRSNAEYPLCAQGGELTHTVTVAKLCGVEGCDSLGSWTIAEEFTGPGIAVQRIEKSGTNWTLSDELPYCKVRDVLWNDSQLCAVFLRSLALIQ